MRLKVRCDVVKESFLATERRVYLLETFLETSKVRLYVNSSKVAVGTENVVIDKPTVQIIASNPLYINVPPRVYPTREVKTVTKYDYALPEYQSRIVDTVREVASEYGFELEVIDVAQLDFMDGDLPKAVRALGDFPVLATKSQTQLALDMSREDIEQLLSREVETKVSKSEPE